MNCNTPQYRFFSSFIGLTAILSAWLLLLPSAGWCSVKIEKLQIEQKREKGGTQTAIPPMEQTFAPDSFHEELKLDENPFSALWPQQSLQTLEAKRQPAAKYSQSRLAVARLEESLSLLEYAESRNSPSLSLHTTLSHYQEQTGSDLDEYNKVIAGGTLSYPLLGSYAKKRSEILTADTDVQEKRLLLKLNSLEELQSLRAHYINYWCAAEQILLGKAFLEHEEKVRNILTLRTHTAHLLAADSEEFLTTFAAAKRDIAIEKAVIHRAIRGIRLLTVRDLPLFRPRYPQLAEIDGRMEGWAEFQAFLLNHHPRLNLLRNRVERELALLEINKNEWINGAIDLDGYTARKDRDTDREYGVSMNLRLDLPLSWRDARSSARAARLAALRRTQAELDAATAEVLETARDTYDHLAVYAEQSAFARQRLKAALESLREKILRAESLPGDVFEKVEQSRYDYYRVAMDYLEALRRELQVRNRHTVFFSLQEGQKKRENGESGVTDALYQPAAVSAPLRAIKRESRREILTAENPAGKKTAMKLGFYLWKSRLLFEEFASLDKEGGKKQRHNHGGQIWQIAKAAGAGRLLVSLDAAQIAGLNGRNSAKNIQKWHTFIQEAGRRGIAVELLLGEPLWILPEYRQNLLHLIEQLQPIPFAGLHLDLEPNQLDEKKYGTPYLLAQLLRTIEEAAAVSRQPLAVSLHPRYFNKEKYGVCLGCALQNMGIKEIALMSYTANPKRTAEIVRPILNRYPKINFAVSQSVERVLSKEESYFSGGQRRFAQKMAELEALLPDENFSGIYIQSYSDYKAMKP